MHQWKGKNTAAWHEHCSSIATNLSVGVTSASEATLRSLLALADFVLLDHMALLLNLWYTGRTARLSVPLTC